MDEGTRILRPAVCVALVAILMSLVSRAFQRFGFAPISSQRRSQRSRRRRSHHHHIRVLLSVPVRAPWRDAILHMLSQAYAPRNLSFGVLLECTQPSDADFGEVASDLRAFVRVVHARAPRGDAMDPSKRLRRLVRRFVDGDETWVVVVDHRVRLARGWDEIVAATLRDAGVQDAVLSAPAAACNDRAAFPTRRRRSDGVRIARNDARLIDAPAALHALPSVCWCAEFTAAHPMVLRRWPKQVSSAVGVAEVADLVHVVPAMPLVDKNAALEEEYLDADEGTAHAAYGPHERVGLSGPQADDAERIRKFGSSRAARLAVEFS